MSVSMGVDHEYLTQPLLGAKLTISELLASVQHGPILSPKEGASSVAALLANGWPDVPPGLRDRAPQLFLDSDYFWNGRRFSFWYGVEFYWRNLSGSWNPSAVISALDLDGVISGEVRGIRHSQITGGSFGTSLPLPNQKHKVVSTLSSTALKPGSYQMTLHAGSATFAWINDVLIYFVTAAGLSVDGDIRWDQSFIMQQNGQNTQKVTHAIRLIE